jgi:7-cyano-7-deazaguanine reductase
MMSTMAVMVAPGARRLLPGFYRSRGGRQSPRVDETRQWDNLAAVMVNNPKSPLRHLGKPSPQPASPQEATLDRVANPHPDTNYVARFTAPEFTTLCPITGQPDFAHFVIDYAPEAAILESKSLKLFLGSFRNHAAFHEDCTLAIARRLVAALSPRWLRIGGYWYPRGGIPIDVLYQTGEPPSGLWLPEPGVPPYRGRG